MPDSKDEPILLQEPEIVTEKPKSTGFLGRISETPCMRQSLLYGVGGGLGVGLLHFLFTSNVKRSTHTGFFAYIFGTIGTWSYCRYKWSEMKMKDRQMQYILENKLLFEGTELDKKLAEDSVDA